MFVSTSLRTKKGLRQLMKMKFSFLCIRNYKTFVNIRRIAVFMKAHGILYKPFAWLVWIVPFLYYCFHFAISIQRSTITETQPLFWFFGNKQSFVTVPSGLHKLLSSNSYHLKSSFIIFTKSFNTAIAVQLHLVVTGALKCSYSTNRCDGE